MSTLKILGAVATGWAVMVLAGLYLDSTGNPQGSQILWIMTGAVAVSVVGPVLIKLAGALG